MSTANSIALADIVTFALSASDFAMAIQTVSTEGTSSASALLMLNALPGLCATAIASIKNIDSNPETGELVTQCEVLLYTCEQLGDFWFSNINPLKDWTVPSDMPLMGVSQAVYKDDAMNHLDEIMANNPSISGMILIPAGTILKVSTQASR